jgi:hypothetical protein
MPIYNAGQSMIRAFEAGLAERRAGERQQWEDEDRKLQQEILQNQLKQMKLTEKLKVHAANVAGQEALAKSMEGLPESEMAAAGQLQGLPSQDLKPPSRDQRYSGFWGAVFVHVQGTRVLPMWDWRGKHSSLW